MRKVPFVNGKYYHVFNRGVEGRPIFMDKSDYYRFVAYLIIFNDEFQSPNLKRKLKESINNASKRSLIVDVIAYCLMPNHFHLLLKQKSDSGIPNFLRKLGIGYTHYFNKKYNRTGVLFQGKSKNVLIESDEQLLHLSRYIHLNPVKTKGIALEKALNYPWSSCRFFVTNEPTVILTNKDVILNQFNKNPVEYLKFLKSYKEELDFSFVKELVLE